MVSTPRPHLAPLRNADARAEYRLLVEHRRLLRLELADLEVIMDGVLLEIALGGEVGRPQPAVAGWELRRRREADHE